MFNRFIFLISQFFIFTTCAVAQDVVTSYLQKDDTPLDKIEGSYYYRNVFLDTIINNTKIYRIEEYYSADNSAKTLGYSSVDKPPLKYMGELQRFYSNKNLASFEKYNKSGSLIDTAYYFYPNKSLKMMLNLNVKAITSFPVKPIEYLAYYDGLQVRLLKNGDGFVRVDLVTGLVSEDSLSYEEGTLSKNKREGLWKGVSGKYRFEENYTNGLVIEGKCFWPDGKVVAYTNSTISEAPEYPGGVEALMEYVSNNFVYPDEAKQHKVSGIINVNFFVDELGNIKNIRVKKDLGYNTSRAAIKVVQTLGKWKPGTLKGIPQKVSYTLPIRLNSF